MQADGHDDAPERTILVVDDELLNQKLLAGMLRHRNFRVVPVADGADAVEWVQREPCDLVLMDVLMPGLDGYEATRRIKEVAGDEFLPVLFVTALNDDAQLARCVECGGDDFIPKPVNRVHLNAKIDSWLRIASVQRTVREQRDRLDAYQQRNELDQSIARDVMQRAAASPELKRPGVRFSHAPAEILSGDIVLGARMPDGRSCFLLGDFTGHGIAAAIGTVPAADVFHDQVARGETPERVLEAINRKLHATLPANIFLAATLVVCDPRSGSLEVWNGGMPDALLLQGDGSVRRVPSRHVPLGVSATVEPYGNGVEIIEVGDASRLWVVSDGITESVCSEGAAGRCSTVASALVEGGVDRLEALVRGSPSGGEDDATVLELQLDVLFSEPPTVPRSGASPAWAMTLDLDAATLRRFSPVQAVVDAIAQVETLSEPDRQSLLTVLAELYSNSLEHGVLGLVSQDKASAEGFDRYYQARDRALRALHDGWIRLRVAQETVDGREEMVVRMTDSGAGFDAEATFERIDAGLLPEPGSLSGRGLALLRGICESVTYRGPGNDVEVRLALGPDRS